MPFQKKALCIGVNYPGTDAELRGACEDALRWASLLVERFGFKRKNVVTMVDQYPNGEEVGDDEDELHGLTRPTKENIMDGLDWLIKDVGEGDVVAFVFAGHGVYMSDSGAHAHESKLPITQALCPLDWHEYEWGVVPHRLITDELLHQYFVQLPGGILLTCIMDCSVSPAIMQLPLHIDFEYPDREAENRPISHGEHKDFRHDNKAWLQHQHVLALPRRLPFDPQQPLWCRLARWFTKDVAVQLDPGMSCFCITACRHQQTALDIAIAGQPCGVLSHCLEKALERLGYRCTYLELMETMNQLCMALRMEDMPYMDQYFQMSYGENATPDECLFMDQTSAFVAEDKTRRRRGKSFKSKKTASRGTC